MPLFLKLIPFRDYLYAAIAAALLVWYNVHVDRLEHRYAAAQVHAVEAADTAATKKANDAAAAIIAANSADYATKLKKAQDTFDANTQASTAANAADIARLRNIAAGYQQANAVLRGTIAASAAGGPISSSPESLGTVPAELGAELAGALRATRDQRDVCYAERDSLTGK
jgi:hypothetical protein